MILHLGMSLNPLSGSESGVVRLVDPRTSVLVSTRCSIGSTGVSWLGNPGVLWPLVAGVCGVSGPVLAGDHNGSCLLVAGDHSVSCLVAVGGRLAVLSPAL